jgi:peptide/nickel transport system substrate-binding protein
VSEHEGDPRNGIGSTRLTRREVLKGALVVGAGAALAPAIAACGGGGSSSPSASASASASAGPKQGGALKVGVVGGSAKEHLDGALATTEPEICNCFQLYDALMGWDENYQMVQLLAESATPNADASVWTVKLRSGVKFHDGTPLTADDVVFSYTRIIDPKNPMMGASQLSSLKASGIKKIDASTVEFHLNGPNVIFDEALALYGNIIVPTTFDAKAPVGTGPFKFTSFSPGQQIVYAANKDYWGGAPHVDTLTVIEFSDPAARVNALLGGTVDAISQLPSAQAAAVTGAGQKVLDAHTGAWQPFTMRIDQKPFNDVRVRQAFRLIIDRKQMIEQAFAGYGMEGNDVYAPFDPGTTLAALPQRAQDLAQAKSLLKAAGYDNNLTVTLTTSDAVGSAAVAAAQVFAEQAKGAGVTVNVNKVDSSVFYGDQYLKWTFAQDFWYTRNYLAQANQGTMPTAPYNECHWKNDKWLALVQEAFKTADKTKRNELVAAAQKIEYDEGGYIVWAFNDQIDAYSSKLGGVVPDKSGVPLSSFHFNKFYFA